MIAPGRSRIGFIGTGVMGAPMAGHARDAGYEVALWARSREKPAVAALLDRGARWAETPAALAAECDAVITIVGYPADVEEIYLGESGIVAAALPGTYLIDMTTSLPALAVRIAEAAAAGGIHAFDAPVTGGDVGAREARLSIMVGGDRAEFATVEPLLRTFGPTVVHQGGPGCGQHAKAANQISIAASMIGVCESLSYARAAGLDPERVLQSIAAGSAGSWSLSNLAPRIIAGDFAPGFFIKHFVKDLGIALGSAADLGIELPGTALAARLYRELEAAGYGDSGTQALWRHYDR